jgi:HEPN domain-containing protein
MSGAEHHDQVRRWLRYAREDLDGAEATLTRPGAIPRHAGFLAQQAAEKALKAVLVFLQIDVPRRHDLDGLRNLIRPIGTWQTSIRGWAS